MLIATTLRESPIGPFQLQAAIAPVHGVVARPEDTDWPQILVLYGMLDALAPSPMVTLNRVVARAMVDGPEAALDQVVADPVLATHHRTAAVQARLLGQTSDREGAREHYRRVAQLTLSRLEQRYLQSRAAS